MSMRIPKRIPNQILCGDKENKAFEQLKEKLCEAASQSLQTNENKGTNQ